uniref:Uncharacterized protein n=1 Tax=Romanomermis culicivorax TaxID=13658 RepID=A0A915K0G6_ROMCU
MKPAMRFGSVVGFVNIDLFNSGFHVEVIIKDDWVHPFREAGSRIAISAVPHTVVEKGTHGEIEILSMLYQQVVYVGVFGGGARRSQ